MQQDRIFFESRKLQNLIEHTLIVQNIGDNSAQHDPADEMRKRKDGLIDPFQLSVSHFIQQNHQQDRNREFNY